MSYHYLATHAAPIAMAALVFGSMLGRPWLLLVLLGGLHSSSTAKREDPSCSGRAMKYVGKNGSYQSVQTSPEGSLHELSTIHWTIVIRTDRSVAFDRPVSLDIAR